MSKEINKVLSTTKEFELDGKIYVIGKITLGDISAFNTYCDDKKREDILKIYKLSETPIDIKEVLAINASTGDYEEAMGSIDGILFLLHRILKKHNKDFTFTKDELADKLGNDEVEKILQVITDNDDEPEDTEVKKKVK